MIEDERTPYDGNGQPVPDGVLVKLWRELPDRKTNSKVRLSQDVVWTARTITHYQVQENPNKN